MIAAHTAPTGKCLRGQKAVLCKQEVGRKLEQEAKPRVAAGNVPVAWSAVEKEVDEKRPEGERNPEMEQRHFFVPDQSPDCLPYHRLDKKLKGEVESFPRQRDPSRGHKDTFFLECKNPFRRNLCILDGNEVGQRQRKSKQKVPKVCLRFPPAESNFGC